MTAEATQNFSEVRDKIIRNLVSLLEKKEFHNIKAAFNGSTYGAPKAYFGHTPDISAQDAKGHFYLMHVALPDALRDEKIHEVLGSLAKHARLHNNDFWLFVPKGWEVHTQRRLRKLEIADFVKLKPITLPDTHPHEDHPAN